MDANTAAFLQLVLSFINLVVLTATLPTRTSRNQTGLFPRMRIGN
jgi:hypothetical protein